MSHLNIIPPPAGRNMVIDVARLLAMLFIVIGHTNIRTPGYPAASPLLCILSMLTFTCYVPFFFFLAGYFAKYVPGGINWKRAKDIFVSLLFWCFIGYFWFGVLHQLESGNPMNVKALINSQVFGILGAWDSVGTPGSWDCWFLKVLIPLVLVSPLLMRLPVFCLLGIVAAAVLLGYAGYPEKGLPFVMHTESVCALAYYAFGIGLRRYVTVDQIEAFVGRVYYWFIPLTIAMLALHIFWHHVFDWESIVTVIWSIVYVLSLSKLLTVVAPNIAKWFATFGPGVFFIYMVQEMLVMQCRWYFAVHPIHRHAYALVPFAIFAVLMCGYWLIRRYLPWACGLLCLQPVRKKN